MWDEVLTKLTRLKAFDRQRQAFGADHHEYPLYPCVPEDELEQVERSRGFVFPEPLRAFYLNVGDGIAGPHYGLREASAVEGYRAV